MTFWYMQAHPGSLPREYNADVMYVGQGRGKPHRYSRR